MIRLTVALAALALSVASVAAQDDPIAARKALMKGNGAAMGQLAPFAKGEKPYDAAAVMAVLQTLNEGVQKFDPAVLFPVGSETGGETAASPKIWEDMAGFQAAVDKFKADAASAAAANPQDAAALGAELGKVGANCGSCHEAWRIKKG